MQQHDMNPISIITRLVGSYQRRDGGTPLTVEQLNRGGLHRAMKVASFDKEKRTVDLAFSSEYQNGERWFGIEILDHSPTSVRLDRLRDGGPLLLNHCADEQIGVIESATIDADRVGRATVRFSKSDEADEIFQDVIDGIRKHVSVGYRVLAAVLEETREDGTNVYRVTLWEPCEISIVPMPFDPTVGIGRSAENPHVEKPVLQEQNTPIIDKRNLSKDIPTMIIKTLRAANGDLVRAECDDAGVITKVLETIEAAGAESVSARNVGATGERSRASEILELGERYKMVDLAARHVKEGKTLLDFQAAAMDEMNKRTAAPLSEQNEGAEIGMADKDVRRYSMMRAIRALANPGDSKAQKEAAFEIECSQEAQRAYGKEAKGILIPADVLGRAFNAGGAANSPAGAQTGQTLVQTNVLTGSFIEMLRNRTTIMKLATVMGGLVGNVEIPKQTGGATAYWLGEGDDATEGAPALGQIPLSPKSLAAYTDITRRLSMQSSPDAEGIVRRDLNNAMAQAIDLAGYYGTGSAFQPRGLKNYTGINGVDFATNGQPTFAELVAMETAIAADNADIGQMGYVGNSAFRGHAKTALKFASAGSATIWEQGGTVNGYRTEITNQVAAADVFFGNFADFIIAMWGGLDLTVDPYSLSKSGGLRLVVFQDVDMALRRVESICWGSAAVA